MGFGGTRPRLMEGGTGRGAACGAVIRTQPRSLAVAPSTRFGVLKRVVHMDAASLQVVTRRSLTVAGRVCTVPGTGYRGRLAGGWKSRAWEWRIMT